MVLPRTQQNMILKRKNVVIVRVNNEENCGELDFCGLLGEKNMA
jgi:hypothetical protein